ncbi:putative protein phosphatase 2C 25, partial [Bienertia sinuspersici]
VIRSLFRTIWDFIKPVLRCFKGNDHHDTWSVELKNHFLGQFSMAVCQANENIEDRSQVEIGENATFVGIYDGHGGQEAADYVLNHLFNHLIEHIVDTKVMTENAIRHAIAATEHGFIEAARNAVQTNPHMALEGCCCVIGIIYRSRLFVANVGDSRAVLGYTLPDSAVFMMHAEPLTVVHNVNVEHIKKELLDAHPSEPELVVANDDGVHLIKNRIQVFFPCIVLHKPDISLELLLNLLVNVLIIGDEIHWRFIPQVSGICNSRCTHQERTVNR